MNCYAVVDTNVIVSALISRNPDSPPRQVFRAMFTGDIIPLYHADILEEYAEVLNRKKFHLNQETVRTILEAIRQFGVEVAPSPTGEKLIDMDDLVFYEVAMEKRNDGAYLVTGNQKHYPIRSFIVTPAEMIDILRNAEYLEKLGRSISDINAGNVIIKSMDELEQT
jgi:uncharacterized protein